MPLSKKMTNAEILKLCKKSPVYEEKYIKGIIANKSEIEERLKREDTIVEIQKHANMDDGIEAITVKIYFNSK